MTEIKARTFRGQSELALHRTRIKLDTPKGSGNGIVQVWADNCGVNGLGCTGPGTLRLSHTGLNIRRSNSRNLGAIHHEFWLPSSPPEYTGGGTPHSTKSSYGRLALDRRVYYRRHPTCEFDRRSKARRPPNVQGLPCVVLASSYSAGNSGSRSTRGMSCSSRMPKSIVCGLPGSICFADNWRVASSSACARPSTW